MVKHGRNKKRRAGRIGRTQLKNRNFTRWDPKPKITDETVKTLWDTTKTPKQNLALMGLNTDMNAVHRNRMGPSSTTTDAAGNNKKPNMIELFDVPDSDALNVTKRLPLQPDEQEYILECMKKYNTNYRKMFRDTKTNNLQHTVDKLQKMGSRFLLLERQDLRVALDDIPTSIQEQMPALKNYGKNSKDDASQDDESK